MICGFLLLFIMSDSIATSLFTPWPATTTSTLQEIPTATTAAEETLSALQLVATPEYPVAAGQRVNLHCFALTTPSSTIFTWHRQENQTWRAVHSGRDLTLSDPDQSGIYRCSAMSKFSKKRESREHAVYIVSVHATVGENLGIAGFFLSLLALIINFAIVLWLGCQRLCDKCATSNTAAKGFPGPEKSQKGGLPNTDSDGDVYMNYTSTNQAYSNLDPACMSGENVYSSLS